MGDENIYKVAEYKYKLIEMKIKIADEALKMRDALYGCDHPKHHKQCTEEYEQHRDELFDLMHQYDELEDEYIMLGGETDTY